jgi:hypothetical protein
MRRACFEFDALRCSKSSKEFSFCTTRRGNGPEMEMNRDAIEHRRRRPCGTIESGLFPKSKCRCRIGACQEQVKCAATPLKVKVTMFKKIALISALALPLCGIAAGTEQKVAPAKAQRAASAASVASAPAAKRKATNANFNQRNSICQKKAADAGLTGAARKQAVLDCVKNS